MTFAYLRDGTPILLRPIERGDADMLLDAWNRASPESRRRRMHGPGALTRRALANLVDVDHVDHEAIVAINPGDYAIVGIARYIRDPRHRDEAELAVWLSLRITVWLPLADVGFTHASSE